MLQPGGVFYAGLNPNKQFSELIKITAKQFSEEFENLLIARELEGVNANGIKYKNEFGIDNEMLELAENIKTVEGGFDAEEVSLRR